VSRHLLDYDGEVRRCNTCCSVGFAELRPEPSFISEESFVRAPLNSRIVSGTTTIKSKGKAKEESLDSFPLEVQEAMILEDLLYVLMVCVPPPLNFRPLRTR
jgi:hypothetical protein